MKRFTHLLTIVLVVTLADSEFALAYEPAIQWQKTFGGSSVDEGYSVQQTADSKQPTVSQRNIRRFYR